MSQQTITAADLDRMEAGLANVRHQELAEARCSCGFDAYRISGIMIDYLEEINAHMAWAQRQPTYRPLSRGDARALIAIARRSLASEPTS